MAANSTSASYEAFHQALKSAKHIATLCGAGLSAESGIPTFRGEGGWWRTFEATELATPTAFKKNPSRVWEFYHYRRELVLKKQPNKAHKALVDFEDKILSQTPQNQTFTVITQNVDGLSSNLKNFIAMHGSLFRTRCTKCGYIEENRNSPICEGLKGTENSNFDINLPIEKLPSCTKCNGLIRPDVVWFNETLDPDILNKIHEELNRCDLFLIIGTSGLVYPAASYANYVKSRGGKLAIFNIEDTGKADFKFIGPCGETLPRALDVCEET
ncbi:DHS-like NAD/FAD-binding domain-containing protein [Glomus cerebriforme]|uniref:NAD-dependent protein deacylase n=1 Tax=Glomus cerebriforme TaxID=658196 RepID=A0A397SS69_9GLOM|nr:DHS-like NAD/FAD-binding domain-containing protein [Glomus cerebriforme]